MINNENRVSCVVFDWAGTTVDFGCFAPLGAFMRVFEEAGAAITADEEIEFSNSFTLPDNILDDDNVALVIMLVDQRDERIVNGLLVGVGKNSLTGINGIEMTAGSGQTEMFTIDGRKVDSGSNIPGVYIMRTVKDGKTEVKKVLLK